MEIGYPEVAGQPPFGRRNVLNGALLVAVAIPPVLCAALLFGWFPTDRIPDTSPLEEIAATDEFAAWLLHHPLVTANLLYFVFVNLVFWVIALVQRSSWLIDPYWTLLPLFLAAFYSVHPLATPDAIRLTLAWTALLVWSARLSYSYFRRERWRFGLREDWRYAKMRCERGGFWWEQFFVVHLTQHLMLVGLTLPFWAIAFRPEPVGPLDFLAFASAMVGIVIASTADRQLDRYMRDNAERQRRGEPRRWLLDSGLWRYSRHPNYFGEQLLWWSLAAFSIACGEAWVVVGTAFNSCVLAGVTRMTEQRMLQVPGRAALYADYRRRTSMWVPWPPRRRTAGAGVRAS